MHGTTVMASMRTTAEPGPGIGFGRAARVRGEPFEERTSA